MASAAIPLVLCEITGDGVALVTYNNPKKLNAWSVEMVSALRAKFIELADDQSVGAVVLTGAGRYFSAGADFGGMLSATLPSTLVKVVESHTRDIFNIFLDMPKPIIAAVQGPAIGGAVTSASLCDAILCSETATFRTPFVELGVSPEGCSTYTFEKWYGKEFYNRMIAESGTAGPSFAKKHGFVQEVVPGGPAELVARAVEVAKTWIGNDRKIVAQGEMHKLKEVNAAEAEELAKSILSANFWECQVKLLTKRKKTGAACLFWLLGWLRPVWSML